MPIYEFKCNTCEKVFDELVPMNTEGDLLKCPKCGQVGARRLISAFAAHGLENGHIAVGRKLTGGESSSSSSESSCSTSGGCCGGACAGHSH
ncbi:MAG TPA: zinc ribbon domain-containing protein [Symbiobacteriaceae bacterium]|jgi:putative FmdB family regulatory protein|nr:zinc ribbon domain-containing protein [Symbiobacteriaceae bacterium]